MTLFVFMFNGILNAQGDTHSYRDYLIVATVANIILDPWFMYGGLGVPAMGVRGIAVATILVQVFGACFLGWKVRRWSETRLNVWHDGSIDGNSLVPGGTPPGGGNPGVVPGDSSGRPGDSGRLGRAGSCTLYVQ